MKFYPYARPDAHPDATLRAFALCLLGLLLLAGGASASDARHGADIGIGLTYIELDGDGDTDEFDVGAVSLRYHYRFSDDWGLEAAVTVKDELSPEVQDPTFLDVSARWTFSETPRTEVFALAGGGFLLFDEVVTLPFEIFPRQTETRSDEIATAHLGIGVLFNASERVYLRADTKYRRLVDIYTPLEESNLETTFGVGLHF